MDPGPLPPQEEERGDDCDVLGVTEYTQGDPAGGSCWGRSAGPTDKNAQQPPRL